MTMTYVESALRTILKLQVNTKGFELEFNVLLRTCNDQIGCEMRAVHKDEYGYLTLQFWMKPDGPLRLSV